MVLFVNGCVRENSRTWELAQAVLASIPDAAEEIRLYPHGPEGLDIWGNDPDAILEEAMRNIPTILNRRYPT